MTFALVTKAEVISSENAAPMNPKRLRNASLPIGDLIARHLNSAPSGKETATGQRRRSLGDELTHETIGHHFKDGRLYKDLLADLVSGKAQPMGDSFLCLQTACAKSNVYPVRNRRLRCLMNEKFLGSYTSKKSGTNVEERQRTHLASTEHAKAEEKWNLLSETLGEYTSHVRPTAQSRRGDSPGKASSRSNWSTRRPTATGRLSSDCSGTICFATQTLKGPARHGGHAARGKLS